MQTAKQRLPLCSALELRFVAIFHLNLKQFAPEFYSVVYQRLFTYQSHIINSCALIYIKIGSFAFRSAKLDPVYPTVKLYFWKRAANPGTHASPTCNAALLRVANSLTFRRVTIVALNLSAIVEYQGMV